jgi:hypothetical protein
LARRIVAVNIPSDVRRRGVAGPVERALARFDLRGDDRHLAVVVGRELNEARADRLQALLVGEDEEAGVENAMSSSLPWSETDASTTVRVGRLRRSPKRRVGIGCRLDLQAAVLQGPADELPADKADPGFF